MSEFPENAVFLAVYLFGVVVLGYGISVIKQMIKEWWFIRKNKIFFEKSPREKEIQKNFDNWLDRWKKQSFSHRSFSWDYSHTKKSFPKTKKDFFYWLLLSFFYIILLLILREGSHLNI